MCRHSILRKERTNIPISAGATKIITYEKDGVDFLQKKQMRRVIEQNWPVRTVLQLVCEEWPWGTEEELLDFRDNDSCEQPGICIQQFQPKAMQMNDC